MLRKVFNRSFVPCPSYDHKQEMNQNVSKAQFLTLSAHDFPAFQYSPHRIACRPLNLQLTSQIKFNSLSCDKQHK